MISLDPLDIIIIAAFFGLLAALALSTRLRENSVLQYLAAGRSLTLPFFVATLVSTWYGGVLAIGEIVSYYGIGTWVLMGVPYYSFAILYALVIAKKVRSGAQISIPERFAGTFGDKTAVVASLLLVLLAVPAAHILMVGTLFQAIVGFEKWAGILLAAVIGLAFLYRGGLPADVRVSSLAFLMMYVGFAAIVGVGLSSVSIPDALTDLSRQDLMKWDGGIGPIGVVSFFILGAWTLVDPGFHQRVAGAASPEVGRRGVLVAVVCWFVFDALMIAAGLIALHRLGGPPEDGLMLFPMLAESLLGPGLKAVFLCGVFGVMISALVGYLLVSGASIGRDLYARLVHEPDDQKVMQWSRVGVIVASLMGIGLALWVPSVRDLWFAWAGAVVGAILVPFLMAYLRPNWRLPDGETALSMGISFLFAVGLMLWGRLNQNPLLEFEIAGQSVIVGTLVPGLAVSSVIIGVMTLVSRTVKP
ncbi:MAG: sodium:solute symporter [Fimbriimonadaceae bacterium]